MGNIQIIDRETQSRTFLNKLSVFAPRQLIRYRNMLFQKRPFLTQFLIVQLSPIYKSQTVSKTVS